jgi:hypothetical protein
MSAVAAGLVIVTEIAAFPAAVLGWTTTVIWVADNTLQDDVD